MGSALNESPDVSSEDEDSAEEQKSTDNQPRVSKDDSSIEIKTEKLEEVKISAKESGRFHGTMVTREGQ